MPMQFEHIFTRIRVRPRKVKHNSLIDDPLLSIQKLTEAGMAWLGELAENYFGEFC